MKIRKMYCSCQVFSKPVQNAQQHSQGVRQVKYTEAHWNLCIDAWTANLLTVNLVCYLLFTESTALLSETSEYCAHQNITSSHFNDWLLSSGNCFLLDILQHPSTMMSFTLHSRWSLMTLQEPPAFSWYFDQTQHTNDRKKPVAISS